MLSQIHQKTSSRLDVTSFLAGAQTSSISNTIQILRLTQVSSLPNTIQVHDMFLLGLEGFDIEWKVGLQTVNCSCWHRHGPN